MQHPTVSSHKNEDTSTSLEQREDVHKLPDLMRQARYRRVLLPYLQYKKRERYQRRTRRSSWPADIYYSNGISMGTCKKSMYSYVFANKNLSDMLYHTVDELKYLTHSQSALIYLYDVDLDKLILAPRFVKSVRCMVTQPIRKYLNLSSYIALERNYIIVEDVLKEFRIPEGFGQYGYSEEGTLIKSVLGVPILTADEELIGVVEFCRNFRQPSYKDCEAEIAVSSIGYVGGAIDQHAKLIQYRRHIALQNFLSDLTKNSCLQEVSANELLPKIVGHTKKAIDAEYVSFLIIDHDYEEPVADYVVETGFGGLEEGYSTTKKVRLDPNRSLMAMVVDSGKTVNILDTETDKQVHMKLDLESGSIRRSILCMPITLDGTVYGAIQLINKKNTLSFNNSDESLLSTCCKYCSIGLLFRGQKGDAKRWKNVILNLEEMITYYMTNNPFDYDSVIPPMVSRAQADELINFRWVPKDEGKRTLSAVMHMLSELIEDCRNNASVWHSWLIRVKKCYRLEMTYHNFIQAVISCNTMYNLIARNKQMFTPTEILALLIASLCNNVDHQGLENTFYQMNQQSLAQIYEQFSLENHHFNTTVFLLRSVDLFPRLQDEYEGDLHQEIYNCIISTSLERSFTFKEKLDERLDSGNFSWDSEEDRELVKSLMTFYSAVSPQCKKTKLTYSSTRALYEEIYNQGSLESSLGYSILPNADRDMKEYMADYQLDFLRRICWPMMETLVRVFPNVEPLRRLLSEIIEQWEDEVRNREIPVWRASAAWKRTIAAPWRSPPPIAAFSARFDRHLRRQSGKTKGAEKPKVKLVFKIHEGNWDKWITKIG
ncbi:cAMP and cAMP-inhibited cGMP 3',5'-cyclic phosphodiesterase 10A-like [Schistocerca gregaria]|uniref:cAMP and cAMP-inhibited cGMP 3',5'-cyclic phosphodiesterase 10A-like n=1 Tax=Schistocerca gregaria TaxID=7010 RepID=UPI00211DDE40|nr:cAMP and cAMP-inhibited cGMP 3',5'-cyclic phosphodiesterase 10A-like [Schistocerca gregaria]